MIQDRRSTPSCYTCKKLRVFKSFDSMFETSPIAYYSTLQDLRVREELDFTVHAQFLSRFASYHLRFYVSFSPLVLILHCFDSFDLFPSSAVFFIEVAKHMHDQTLIQRSITISGVFCRFHRFLSIQTLIRLFFLQSKLLGL